MVDTKNDNKGDESTELDELESSFMKREKKSQKSYIDRELEAMHREIEEANKD